MPELSYNAYDLFVYEVDFSNLVAGSSQTSNFTVQQEADFLLTKLTLVADIAAAAFTEANRPVPLVTMMINDTGSGRNLMSSAVPLPNLFGAGGLPFILPRQRLFVASSVVNITLTNYDAATDYNIRLSFIGEKAFRYGGR
jgi:hypothetical protein